ncbi:MULTISPECIES: GvpL/GvpF family gas vesicle protein [unclassified Bradyrhizobium]|uniref:GvpL/GvpF family gas vesicle protein n=2 Tax=Bradyrhizobium TaxID=374 RepID=UPI0028E5118D|nr:MULTISPECIES: GvpL/GvpF family gas vesicle protein [unclassified Bradyrhizobium]
MSALERPVEAITDRSPPATVVTLFAFARAADMVRAPPLEREGLLLHRAGQVAAVAGLVPAEDYCGAAAAEHLADAAWLAPRVRQHAELVSWTMTWSAVFPVPFGTLYSSLDGLSAFVHAHEATIMRFLEMTAGKQEWELQAKASLADPGVLDELARDAWPGWQELPKGTRYMRICRDRAKLHELGRAKALEMARGAVGTIQALTTDMHEARRGRDSGGNELVARWALLVPTENIQTLQARTHALNGCAPNQLLNLSLSGPWPPFSFRPDLR